MIDCELRGQDCELAVSTPRKARKSAVEARWRSGDVEDCKSAATHGFQPIVRTIHAPFYPPNSVGFRSHCELSPYFPRRSSSRSTASRMKAERSSSPLAASIRSSTAGAQRIGTITVFSPVPPSGFLPIGAAIAAEISCANSYIHPCIISYRRLEIAYRRFGGKRHGIR
jgi:hypothetical protein